MPNEAATAKDAQFVLISILPDVCLTPTKSGYPVPYVITHKMDHGRWGQVLPFASPSLISSSRSVSLKALCPETIRLMRDTDSTNCRAISDKLICDA